MKLDLIAEGFCPLQEFEMANAAQGAFQTNRLPHHFQRFSTFGVIGSVGGFSA